MKTPMDFTDAAGETVTCLVSDPAVAAVLKAPSIGERAAPPRDQLGPPYNQFNQLLGVATGADPVLTLFDGAGSLPGGFALWGAGIVFQVDLTTGLSPLANATIFGIELFKSFPNGLFVQISPANAVTARLNQGQTPYATGDADGNITVSSNSAGLAANQSYSWTIVAIGY